MALTRDKIGVIILLTVFMFAARINEQGQGVDVYFNYIVISVFGGLYVLFFRDYRVLKNANIIIIFYSIISLVNTLLSGLDGTYVIKQSILILFFINGYQICFQALNVDINKIISIYLKGTFYLSVIGLIELVFFLLNSPIYFFNNRIPVTDFGLIRISSLTSEPSHLAVLLMPAVFMIIAHQSKRLRLQLKGWQQLIIIAVFTLTFSSVGVLGFIFGTFLLFIVSGGLKAKFLIVCSLIAVSLLAMRVGTIKTRIDDSIRSFMRNDYNGSNLSTMALYTNFVVASESFKANPLFGSGLGTHEIKYYETMSQLRAGLNYDGTLNAKDANSLFLRLLSETGLLGLLGFTLFLVRYSVLFVGRNIRSEKTYIYYFNLAVLATLFMFLCRFGHYAHNGLAFFVLIYYHSYNSVTKLIS